MGCWCVFRDIKFYAFPPFSVLSRVLSEIKEDNASGILVVPLWPTQPWFPVMLDLLIDHPRHIAPDSRNLHIPGNPLLHPLHKRLTLLVTLLSGQRSLVEAYHTSLHNSSLMPGERAPKSSITPLYEDGGNIVVNGKYDSLTPPVNEVINFLSSLFQMGLGYGGITFCYYSWISQVGWPPFDPEALKKGLVMSVRPSLVTPWYWDTTLLIKYLASLNNVDLYFQRACWKTLPF